MNSRILLYDLETSPLVSYTWQTWQTDVIQVKEDWKILCFAYKWLGEKKTYVIGQDDFKGYKGGINDDKHVVEALWALFEQADVLVGHNSISFDDRKSMARFIQHGLQPPSPSRQIDTKRTAKRQFGFTSNKLSDLAKYLKVEDKGSPGGFETWLGCMSGDKKAWRKMKRYNKQDVVVLEQIYLKLRAWDKQSVPLNVMEDRPEACPKCGKGKMHKSMKYYSVKSGTQYQYLRCVDCGGMAKSRVPIDSFKKVDYV